MRFGSKRSIPMGMLFLRKVQVSVLFLCGKKRRSRVDMAFTRWMGVQGGSLSKSFGSFLFMEKRTSFPFGKGEKVFLFMQDVF